MSKELKRFIVKEFVSKYRDVGNFVFISYQGINTIQVNKLREDLRNNSIGLRVIKNSLFLLALKEIGISEITQYINGPCGVAIKAGDYTELAKVIVGITEKIPNIKINVGYFAGTIVTPEEINELSRIPERPIINAQLLSGIISPIMGLLNIFNSLSRNILICLQEIRDKKA